MSDAAIRVRGLSKRYRIGERVRYRTLRDSLTDTLMGPFRRARKLSGGGEEFWALKDVSFEVKRGEVVGVIGRNGAGKSTLLKLLSRITEPTEGVAEIHGRVGSLLEVGTGFHPELTGRENVFLNGAILGMRREEIRRKFDEIVAFSEIEKFLDTPVKHYSSGMYTRLAFAVAAHLEPEILIVDEVLAVGDAEFQKKCLGKMQDVAGTGRTVLFVSHNMAAVQSLCSRCVLLKAGQLARQGPPGQLVAEYLRLIQGTNQPRIAERADRGGAGPVRFQDLLLYGDRGQQVTSVLSVGQHARFVLTLNQPWRDFTVLFAIYDQIGQVVVDFNSRNVSQDDEDLTAPVQAVIIDINELTLAPGRYRANIAAFDGAGQLMDHVENAATIDVEGGTLRSRATPLGTRGVTVIPHRWAYVKQVE
jgi:lipopolysaccharide transport system ATP-binding protein